MLEVRPGVRLHLRRKANGYKQAIFIRMIEVSGRYNEPLKTRFRDAAINFRLPYFDYFRPRRGPGRYVFPGVISGGQTVYDYDFSAPAIFTTPSVTVRYFPDGKPRQLSRNPLHHYAFQVKSGQLSTAEWDTISRDVGSIRLSAHVILTR